MSRTTRGASRSPRGASRGAGRDAASSHGPSDASHAAPSRLRGSLGSRGAPPAATSDGAAAAPSTAAPGGAILLLSAPPSAGRSASEAAAEPPEEYGAARAGAATVADGADDAPRGPDQTLTLQASTSARNPARLRPPARKERRAGPGGGGSDAGAASSPAAAGSAPAAAAAATPLHVAFVGPELADLIADDSDGRALPQGTALALPPPPAHGRSLLYSYHLCTYQAWAAGRTPLSAAGAGAAGAGAAGGKAAGRAAVWRVPDLAVAFNSGIADAEQALWAPALGVLVRHGVPVVFTSYDEKEAGADAAAWRAAGGAVSLGPERNPFQALEPIAEPSQVDAFYYHNYWWWCGRGGAEGTAAPKGQ
ncbi:hypothetical protein TSOC_007471 [Tetrabaena socialis]|uniref:Mitochondrial splicing suppressor 51-like C-terminal domain-containing protein n=1 Tax=Tetrabaena socialis TaxID=47790 RepID=A0A2J8A105_9CHLO|nr:hypothetical protein TSOC_007471 [Tetrabaena socialis]|eukprot:PNH06200.1 hypothetical protein TSOC_007471 [Tetrabaena socialis]